MMHLVGSSLRPPGLPMPQSPSSSSASDSSSSDSTARSSSATASNLDSQSNSSSSIPETCDGLRYRGDFPPQNVSGVSQCPDAAQVPLQGGLPAHMPSSPMYAPMQMLWWQQMYARHYYMQYQAAVAASQPPSTSPPPPSSSPHQLPQPEEPVQPPLGPNPAQNPLQENQAANPFQMNAQGGPALNEDELNRDWLDWIYAVSRAGVLLSIVYFYSSFSRFVMVVGAMLLVYLHQARWFPFRPEQHNLPEGGGGDPQDEAQRQQDMQEMERLMDEGMEDDDGSEEDVGGLEDQAQSAAALQEQNLLTVAWSFISTFFTSLIPEGWPHVAN
nr:homocysteine-responsive endoplasmic reticulum-resident ubiquitin-like domain member 2 protein [Nothobranchius furzeri]XP_015805323.2 homocysteine-responsive endoplasmic reticulum-resident ubiquitin-like domain member 2 protein [Nothobranchius furzeri]XP_015805324.2 homocysteine-responsive endoplasmic reticulum-resident ubiquitin-like domain member 2 protein [Nothobranchius furzeri]XP_015805325.2 homocysteine-responsive endoplasmic reticulum-resident ubiquitin-like domain member 2 protein [Not